MSHCSNILVSILSSLGFICDHNAYHFDIILTAVVKVSLTANMLRPAVIQFESHVEPGMAEPRDAPAPCV